MEGVPSNFLFLWPDPNENNYWLYFYIQCNKNGIKGLWGDKGLPSLGPGPALVLQWTLTWPYISPNMVPLYNGYIFAFYATKIGSKDSGDTYGLYFCILCNKNRIKGLWGHKGRPPLGLGPALVLQWTLPWP